MLWRQTNPDCIAARKRFRWVKLDAYSFHPQPDHAFDEISEVNDRVDSSGERIGFVVSHSRVSHSRFECHVFRANGNGRGFAAVDA
jgi:hypothetical protein